MGLECQSSYLDRLTNDPIPTVRDRQVIAPTVVILALDLVRLQCMEPH